MPESPDEGGAGGSLSSGVAHPGRAIEDGTTVGIVARAIDTWVPYWAGGDRPRRVYSRAVERYLHPVRRSFTSAREEPGPFRKGALGRPP